MKISPNLYGRLDGSKFWHFLWFPANSLLCVIKHYTVYPLSISTWFLKYRMSLDFFSISNSKKNQFRNKLDFLLSSNLIFTACVSCKNQVWTRQKLEFISKWISFRVCNKGPNWHFKNQAQIDTVKVCIFIVIRKVGNPYLKELGTLVEPTVKSVRPGTWSGQSMSLVSKS